jgi:tRNA modification GTPase
VSEIPGTTRDIVRQSIDIEGVPLHIIDTAGLRDAGDPIETIGISRAWASIENADLVLWISDATGPATKSAETALISRLPSGVPQIHVCNKIDLAPPPPDFDGAAISAKTGEGIDELKRRILHAIGWNATAEDTILARERHLLALVSAATHLDRTVELGRSPELLAEELKLAQNHLSSITGEFTADELLGRIFSRFCIGK